VLERRARLTAFAAGLVSAAGFAPLSLWPLTLAALALLLHLVSTAQSWQRAALLGWLFGVGHFTFGNGWIATAFTYQAEMPAWLGWIAVVLLALYLAVYPALAALGAWALARRGGWPLVLAFAGLWTVTEWLRRLFGEDTKTRFRPSYFPFTEPSAEFDFSCFKCHGTGKYENDRCRPCKGSGWIELGGSGMVHPNVLRAVNVDPTVYSGFAFGFGLDRMAALMYEIDDIRYLFENDVRFLEQFR